MTTCLCEATDSKQDLSHRCHCTRQASCGSVLKAALDCYDAFITHVLMTTCCPEHHTSPALGTLSDRNIIAQVSWEHATCCTRIDGRFSFLEALNRSQVPTLLLVDVPYSTMRQPVTMLQFCQPCTMLSTTFPTVPIIIRSVTVPTVSKFSQPVNAFVTNFTTCPACHSTRQTVVDYFSLRGLNYQILQDLELVNNSSTRWPMMCAIFSLSIPS